MKLACPACGSLSSLDALLGNEGAREAVMAALAMPAPIGKPLVMYLALFRPPKRSLSFDRVASLLNELLPMIAAARIERSGRTWSAPQEYWAMALNEMIVKRDKLTLPLKSHSYLLAIIEGYGQKAEGKQEAQKEDRLAGRTPVGACPAREPEASRARHAPTRETFVPAPVPPKPRTRMPADVLAAIGKSKSTGGNDDIS